MERSDVRISDEGAGAPDESVIVDTAEQPHRAIAAANAPDGIDGRVVERLVEVSNARVIGAGEVSLPGERIGTGHCFPTEGAGVRDGALEIAGIAKGPGGGDERHAGAGSKWWRPAHFRS